MPDTTISLLSESIFRNIKVVDSYLKANNLPGPSFDVDGPTFLDIGSDGEHVEEARVKALEAAVELVDLLQGPLATLRPLTNGASLQAISRWNVASKVPLDGEVSFTDLAKECGVNAVDLRRVLRYAMCYHRLFCEPREGYVAHTLGSRKLAEEPLLGDGLWLLGDLTYAAMPKTVDALEKWQDQEPSHTAIALVSGKEVSTYELMQELPGFAPKFARAMTSFAKYNNRSAKLPRINFVPTKPFQTLGKATVVDIGGSRGTDAMLLAEKYPDLSFIVQDLPPMIANAEAAVPPPLQGRIKFMPYSFFTPQTVSADAYLIKQCFHNWPDHYCVRIIKNQIPVMKPGTKIIVIDSLIPAPGTMSLMAERMARAFDMLMLTQTNGREREAEDWKQLFKQADERFKVTSMHPLASPVDFGPATGIIEVVWEG
ncbi:S-adenosyl-L-methionine-dependent methyltransferase [Cryphonectria parasitica EP155]|uniref:S-adenosyl-L-methionine-dependent methyltransferase n=1 Tax=Cryphonectria parasitica (strain ATCC 38755 / EP155) TaxID=660469 RepID=A0A9P4YBV8_CRYP1|nr:S-adenosyl-L-methionine-dependent methyltransferase [Cryphonectria parasitica EP155]KAF3770022.1 S-adenosyl-L-methionine-dependent methyltransferase [Cryphonectria parasitica EP155]